MDESSDALQVDRNSKKTKLFDWTKNQLKCNTSDFDSTPLAINSEQNFTTNSPPISFFSLFVDEHFLAHIKFQTNLYNQQRQLDCKKKIIEVSVAEILKVLGIVSMMGIHKWPNRRMYWAPATKVNSISEAMTRNRFEDILRILHFNDNSLADNNKLHKLQPVLDHFNKKFQDSAKAETCQAVDEMMIAFKGRHALKVYMPNKPTKWGYKLWCRAGVSGYVYAFEVSGGLLRGIPKDYQIEYDPKESECVVLRLCESLQSNKHKIFFDNLFATPELLVHLGKRQVYATATLRANRIRNCPLASDKELKKKGRGSFDFRTDKDGGVMICKWWDSKGVLCGSNYVGIEPQDTCSRFDRKKL